MPASAVKSSAAVEAVASAMEATAHVAAELATRRETTAEPAAVESSVKAASTEAATVESSIKAAPAEARTEEPTPAEAATEPGSGSDKEPAGKPIRPVVAIRRAVIRVITVVAVGAHRRRPVVTIARTVHRAADSNADDNSLRMRRNSRRQNANTE